MNRSVPCLPRHEIEERGDCVTIRFRRADYVPLRGKWDAVIERQEPILALLDGTEDGVAWREIVAGFELAPPREGDSHLLSRPTPCRTPCTSSRLRAAINIPRSSTHSNRRNPKRERILCTCDATVEGSPGSLFKAEL